MDIKGISSITTEDLVKELGSGAKFVIYQYSISIVILSFKQPSDIYSCDRMRAPLGRGSRSRCSLWWPAGGASPLADFHHRRALWNNLRGGKDVTAEVVNMLGVQLAKATAA